MTRRRREGKPRRLLPWFLQQLHLLIPVSTEESRKVPLPHQLRSRKGESPHPLSWLLTPPGGCLEAWLRPGLSPHLSCPTRARGPGEHPSLKRRDWWGDGATRRCGGIRSGQRVAQVGVLAHFPRNSLRLASKPGERRKLQATQQWALQGLF